MTGLSWLHMVSSSLTQWLPETHSSPGKGGESKDKQKHVVLPEFPNMALGHFPTPLGGTHPLRKEVLQGFPTTNLV